MQESTPLIHVRHDTVNVSHLTDQQKRNFWSKVEKTDGCWLFKSWKTKVGYGRFRVGQHRTGAHRVSYFMHFGPIPDGLFVLHDCPGGDNPSCVNPAHLWLGDHDDNMRDMREKDRQAHNGGDKNGSRIHPESVQKGDQHWSRRNPSAVPRGEAAGNAKITEKDVREIRRIYALGGVTQRRLADRFGVEQMVISDVTRRVTWKHVV